MSRAAMQQALEALEDIFGKNKVDVGAINALRAALAEPEQQPVAWMESPHGVIRANPLYRIKAPQSVAWSIPLYTAPIPRRPLTDEEMPTLFVGGLALNSKATTEIVRAVEKAHGIGAQT